MYNGCCFQFSVYLSQGFHFIWFLVLLFQLSHMFCYVVQVTIFPILLLVQIYAEQLQLLVQSISKPPGCTEPQTPVTRLLVRQWLSYLVCVCHPDMFTQLMLIEFRMATASKSAMNSTRTYNTATVLLHMLARTYTMQYVQTIPNLKTVNLSVNVKGTTNNCLFMKCFFHQRHGPIDKIFSSSKYLKM